MFVLLFFALFSLCASNMPLLWLKTRTTGKGDNNINHVFTQYRSILLGLDANRGVFEMRINQIMEYSSLAYGLNIEGKSHFEHIISPSCPQYNAYFSSCPKNNALFFDQ